jgi:hypothetical protein
MPPKPSTIHSRPQVASVGVHVAAGDDPEAAVVVELDERGRGN